jgi:hypothetical protein
LSRCPSLSEKRFHGPCQVPVKYVFSAALFEEGECMGDGRMQRGEDIKTNHIDHISLTQEMSSPTPSTCQWKSGCPSRLGSNSTCSLSHFQLPPDSLDCLELNPDNTISLHRNIPMDPVGLLWDQTLFPEAAFSFPSVPSLSVPSRGPHCFSLSHSYFRTHLFPHIHLSVL